MLHIVNSIEVPTCMHSFKSLCLAWALHAACKRGSYVVKLPAPLLRTNRESLPALPRRRTKSGWSIISTYHVLEIFLVRARQRLCNAALVYLHTALRCAGA
jgi:hypothetical protein